MSSFLKSILVTALSSIGDDVLVPLIRRILIHARKFVVSTENELDNIILDAIIDGLDEAIDNGEIKPKSKGD